MLNNQSNIEIIQKINLKEIPKGSIQKYWLEIIKDGMGVPIYIPIIIARGIKKGKVLGLTAVVHGNELNGIPVIQRLFKDLDIKNLNGTIIGVPVVNVPSFLRKKRRFPDGKDLNHIMPGKPNGTASEVYAWRLVNKVIKHFDYLLDLHTASNGRINSYYIRADLNKKTVKKIAMLHEPQIIVHNPPNDGTLRGIADELNIPAITLEVGNPNLFQRGMIKDSVAGIINVLSYLKFINTKVKKDIEDTVICKKSYWIYTDTGGLLTVHPNITQIVKKGEKIASLSNVFGDVIKEYFAPEEGIVIGKSVNPVNQAGGRVLHLGIMK